jgi:hypothetical protein
MKHTVWGNTLKSTNNQQQQVRVSMHMPLLSEMPYLRNARWWMVGEHPPKQSSRRNFATSSGDSLESFLCTPSKTRIVAAFVSITTSNCNNKSNVSDTDHLQIQRSRVRFPALLERNSSGSGLENREYSRGDPLRWPRNTLYPQKFALTSPSGGRSVDIVCLLTKVTEFELVI